MLKLLVMTGAVLVAGPAAAGCFNYSESNTEVAPKVKLCVSGKCEDTSLLVECSNVNNTMVQFQNGLSVSVSSADGEVSSPVVQWKGRKVKASDVKCTDLNADEAACNLLQP